MSFIPLPHPQPLSKTLWCHQDTMIGLKWQHSSCGQLDSHWCESKDTAGTTGIYPLLLLHSFPHTVIKGSLDNSRDWGTQLVRHENILTATRGYALCLKNSYVPHQSKLGFETFNSFLYWQADILTLWFVCLFVCLFVFWLLPPWSYDLDIIFLFFFFVFLSRLVLTAGTEVSGMQRGVPGHPPLQPGCPDTSPCAYWENGANPPLYVPYRPRSEEVDSIFNCVPGAFPLWS